VRSVKAMNVKVIGSEALTPQRKLFSSRAPVRANARPMSAPIAAISCL
jgi:hypothetical protein